MCECVRAWCVCVFGGGIREILQLIVKLGGGKLIMEEYIKWAYNALNCILDSLTGL